MTRYEKPYTIKPSGALKFKSSAIMAEYQAANPDCVCYYDDYDAHMDPKIECVTHGEAKRMTRPNHFVHDSLGDPATCKGDHNHPKYDVPGASYRPPPGHYSTSAGIDPWAVWDAFDLDRYTANAVKYLLRAGKKDIAPRLDDLKKARDYINKAIEMEEKREGS